MKQLAFLKILSVVTCLLLFCVFVPTATIAQYIYDDSGQLFDGQADPD